ncbi:putative regulator of septum formation [Diaminobutyricimonas aerilata]|uniref:Putative regulator of septum formation n=1 Tax=Diaminobutyricimonas aerilata TaxID=1162967 RepID=A0A2M9CLM6_9MICO|nr:septum formation family protein [Diaminobutyricimonas aerilata]PJJ72796.1 putative regulator of septum formation [Diaminobutyricimonas aerilata]
MSSSPLARTLAVAAIALAGVTLSGCSLLSQFGGAGSAPQRDEQNQVTEAQDDADVFAIMVGDCLNDGEQTDTEVMTLPIVPCDEEHDSEAFHSEDLPDGEYPGQEAVAASAEEICAAQFPAFAGIAFEESTLNFGYYSPTQESWEQRDDREILCTIYALDPETGEPVRTTGTLEGAAR